MTNLSHKLCANEVNLDVNQGVREGKLRIWKLLLETADEVEQVSSVLQMNGG